MEKIFLEILATQKEMLAELRLIRQELAGRETAAASVKLEAAPLEMAKAPVEEPVSRTVPASPVADVPPAPSPSYTREESDHDAPFRRLEEAFGPFAKDLDVKKARHAPKLTLRELQDIGGSFLEGQGKKPRTEAEDGRDSIMDEIKDRNRKKRDAFSEFERLTRNR